MATSLKHVQESMNGGVAPQQQEESSFTFTDEPTTTTVPERQYVVFKLVKKKQRALNIDGICDGVENPKTKRPERIWLIRGTHSIWQSELTDTLKDKDYVSRNRESLRFLDGICRIPVHDVLKLEYARANVNNVGKQRNGAGKRDYYEYDAAEEQRMRFDKQMSRIKLIQRISEMDAKKVEMLALYLEIKPYDEETSLPKTPDGFKTELLIKADTQPDIVGKYMDSIEVEISYLVRKAILDAKIDLAGQNGNALWAGGKGFICKIPAGRKPIEYLTELAMTNSNEGRRFKEQIQTV